MTPAQARMPEVARRGGLVAPIAILRDRARSSLWLVPSAMIVGAIALAVATISMDRAWGADLREELWPLGIGAEGTRLTLSTLAGSVMTVTGVAFSMTIVVIQLAASQYSPRIVRGLRRDRLLQITLGVFTATFVHALIVLRVITAADEAAPGFTAPISVSASMVLGIASIVALVTMVHHVAESAQVSSLLASIVTETRSAIERACPEDFARGGTLEVDALPDPPAGTPRRIDARRSGYVTYVDVESIQTALGAGVLRLEARVGDYVRQGEPLASVWSADDDGEAVEQRLARSLVIGEERTIHQDPGYGLRLVTDVALRALSPGVLDPTTALECVDTLGTLLCDIARRRMPAATRRRGSAVVIVPRRSPAELVASAFDEIVDAAPGSPRVLRAVAEAARALMRIDPRNEERCGLARLRKRIEHALERSQAFPDDLDAVRAVLSELPSHA